MLENKYNFKFINLIFIDQKYNSLIWFMNIISIKKLKNSIIGQII